MAGLDKILKHIEEDASAAAKVVIDQAKSEADRIRTAAKAEGKSKCSDIKKQSEIAVQASLSRSESAAALQRKKLILEAKQKLIDEVIENSKKSLMNLSSQQYFEVILKMAAKYALHDAGRILFSEEDKKRLPKNFDRLIQGALSESKGASLVVGAETKKINGGFVLIYGDIEENCSFDALFFAARDILQDKVCALLFE